MYQIQGTGGIWMQDGDSSSKEKSVIYLDGKSPHHRWEPFEPYQKKYEHPLWKSYLYEAETSDHGELIFSKCGSLYPAFEMAQQHPLMPTMQPPGWLSLPSPKPPSLRAVTPLLFPTLRMAGG